MKKDFKTRIAEVAAKIAEINEEYDDVKRNLPPATLQQLNSDINVQKDLAKAMLDIAREIINKEPSMYDIETRAGWNMIFAKLKQIAGEKEDKAGAEKVPDVSADDAEKMGIPTKLGEAFNRINRK
jgi:hypothetical protein